MIYSDTSANEDNSFRNRIRQPKLLAVSNVNNPVGLVCLPYVMWSAHFFATHIQTEKISSWNGPTVHVCCFVLARASPKTFVSRIHSRQPSPKNSKKKNLRQPKNSLGGSLVSRGITVYTGLVMHVKHTISYHNSIYNRLPENQPSGSKHIEDIKKIKN